MRAAAVLLLAVALTGLVCEIDASSTLSARVEPHPHSLALRRSKTHYGHPNAAAALGAPAPRAGRGRPSAGSQPRGLAASQASLGATSLQADLDRIFADPVLSRALIGVRVESLGDGQVLYARDDTKLVMPASNMKLLTMAAAAERLGWDFKYETRLEAAGEVASGTLHGDLVVVGGGDPSIGSTGLEPAPLFAEWAGALARAGVRRVDGRLVGDDTYFDDQGLGAGWAWDYLGAGYAAPSGGLSYNENAAALRIRPGAAAGDPATVDMGPPGHLLQLTNQVRTDAAGATANIDVLRFPRDPRLIVRGTVPLGKDTITSAAVDNPTKYFVEGFRLALAARGIQITGGAWDLDDVPDPPAAAGRRLVARADSLPLASLAASCLKASQNFYAETIFKTLGRVVKNAGTAEAGRAVVRETLESWGIPADAFVMYDGSGLSRYNYVTAGATVGILRHVWGDPRLRGPFVAALPVAGHDGTLGTRMKGTALDARVEAKTGTISNVRSLSGYLETKSGDRLVFSIIANHFTAPTSQVDAVVERALARLAER